MMHDFSDLSTFPIYDDDDLGINFRNSTYSLKIWAPTAEEVILKLYRNVNDKKPETIYRLIKAHKGIWHIDLNNELDGNYYTVQIKYQGVWQKETPDIFAKVVGTNGQRAMLADLTTTDPLGWEFDKGPQIACLSDCIIYELHLRDISVHQSSGIIQKGTFAGLSELKSISSQNLATGLSHIKSLGVTHLQLLPFFDFASIDESIKNNNTYNWGYDPLNYNTPEGSYASDPQDGTVRIKECKEMIKAIHDVGLGVIMDVVYNHTGPTEDSPFNLTVPGYFYRFDKNGGYSNASACGNEIASERPMVRKFIIDSVCYWAKEYHIDGFRFDLMGILDIETMSTLYHALRQINPKILMYGEGWTANESPLAPEQRATKENLKKLVNIGAFNDDFRDAIKGSWIDLESKGFVSAQPGLEESIKFGIVGASFHPQVSYDKVNYSKHPWALSPFQSINYVSCHDNHTLFDKLTLANPGAGEEEIKKMHLLSLSFVLLAQGTPFLHAGTELMRTKKGDGNSYQSPDRINAIDWQQKAARMDIFNFVKSLIKLRKNHPAFRLQTSELIRSHLTFLSFDQTNVVGFQIKGKPQGEVWERIIVIFNGNIKSLSVKLPIGKYKIVMADFWIDENGPDQINDSQITLSATSATMLVSID